MVHWSKAAGQRVMVEKTWVGWYRRHM